MEKALSKVHNLNDHHDKSGETDSHSSRSTNPAEGHSDTRTSHDTNTLTIDWDGPDDPETPRK